VSVGYLEMAFLPREQSQRSPAFIRGAYVAAAILSGLALVEIFILNPGSSWELLTGIRQRSLVLVVLALSILATPLVMIYRALRQPATYTRRQVIILLAGTSVVLLPFIFLTAIPLAITGKTLLPVEVTVPLLGAIPATYAYVIYRHRYLRLDLFAGRTIMLLLAALAISIFFFAGLRLAQSFQQTAPLAPLVGMVSLFVGFGMVGKASGRLQSAVDSILFGPDRHFEQALKSFTDELLANPQSITLRTILLEKLPEALDIRQAALLLRDDDEKLIPFSTTNTEDLPALDSKMLSGLSDVALHQVQREAPIFQAVPWARLAVPLQVKGAITGLLLLGRKIPDAQFDSHEVEFLQKVASSAAVAGDNIQLFESLQDMAQDRLRLRSAERKQLAFRLHDEPLRRTYTIARQIEELSSAFPADHPLIEVLQAQREEVRTLSRELRDICTGLRPPILGQGFQLTLRNITHSFQANNPNVTLELAMAGDEEPAISEEALESGYHVITEALNNVSRHAHATHVRITVESVQGSLRICITDNGSGTRLAQLSLPELARRHQYGIVGMDHWAKLVDGRLRMYPAAQQGTVVELLLPLQAVRS
jgi:two-component system sensor histidine kinase ComP